MYRSTNNGALRQRKQKTYFPPTYRRQINPQFTPSWLTGIIGCLIFSFGMALLYNNEVRTVKTAQSHHQILSKVISLQSTSVVYAENSGHLVHISGVLVVGEPLTEPEYGVAISAVKLKRRVQMYQWVEVEDKEENQLGYMYVTEWKDKVVNCSQFYVRSGHFNPSELPMKTHIYISEDVTIGKFILGDSIKDKFTDYILITSDERPERRDIRLHSGIYYHSQDVWNPEVGDIRVQFSYSGKTGEVVSIIAMQVGNKLEPYDSDMMIVQSGMHGVEDMLVLEHGVDWRITWVVRGMGWALMYFGTNLSTAVIRVLVSRYSILYDILVLGIGDINMAMSLSMSLVIVALAWVWYRPILASECSACVPVSRYSILYDILVLGIGDINMAMSLSMSLVIVALAWVWYRPILAPECSACVPVSRYSILYDILVLGIGDINMAMSLSMSLVIVALAWVWYRPILAPECSACVPVSRYSILYDILVLGIGDINMAMSLSMSLVIVALAWVWYRPILAPECSACVPVSRYSILYDILVLGIGDINMAMSLSMSLVIVALAWVWYRPILASECSACVPVSRYSILYDILVLGIGDINMAMSLSMSLVIVALAWVWYRPILALFLITASTLPFVWSAIRIYRIDSRENRYYRRI